MRSRVSAHRRNADGSSVKSDDAAAALVDVDQSLRRGFILADFTEHLASTRATFVDTAASIRELLARYSNGTISYDELATSLPSAFADGCTGLRPSDLEKDARDFVQSASFREAIFPFAVDLLGSIRSAAIDLVVVAGVPGVVLRAFSELEGAAALHGIELEVTRHETYTGAVASNPATSQGKAAVVEAVLQRGYRVVLAVGDSPADLPMFEAASSRIVIGNNHGLPSMSSTMRLSPDTYKSGACRQLRKFVQEAI